MSAPAWSDSQAFTSFAAAVGEHAAAGGRRHAGAETVRALSFQVVWLKCSFHGLVSKVGGPPGPGGRTLKAREANHAEG